jgi:hypothetical protein
MLGMDDLSEENDLLAIWRPIRKGVCSEIRTLHRMLPPSTAGRDTVVI